MGTFRLICVLVVSEFSTRPNPFHKTDQTDCEADHSCKPQHSDGNQFKAFEIFLGRVGLDEEAEKPEATRTKQPNPPREIGRTHDRQ